MAYSPIETQARIIWAVTTIFARIKAKESPLGILTLLLEPIATILILTFIFSSIRFRVPALGDYIMLFFMTAIVPVSTFRLAAVQSVAAMTRLRQKLVMPQLRPLDLVVGAIFLNFCVMVSLFVGITIAFALLYEVPWPDSMLAALFPILCNSIIGFGIGMLNGVIRTWFPFWLTIFGFMSMPLMIISGVFYLAESMPTSVLKFLYYNPLLHSSEITRTYYFENFESDFFDPYYYYGFVLAMLFLGLLLERYFRYRLATAK